MARLALLAVLILAVVALAGDPPPSCTRLDTSVDYKYVGPTATITITFDAAQWGIPSLSNRVPIPSGNVLTVVGDPQPSDGKWYFRIAVSYVKSYTVKVTTYTINCSGTIRTWKVVEVIENTVERVEDEKIVDLSDQPLRLWYLNSWTISVAPPLAEAVPGADEYDPSNAAEWPENNVAISYWIFGPQYQLSGLTPSSWNYGENVASYVP